MKKIGFVFALHGIVFSLFMILNMMINEYIYAFLENTFDLPWLVQLLDLAISAVLYVSIYTVVYFAYKFMVVHVKKEIINHKGEWYHVHIKHDENGWIPSSSLRAGITTIEQDLYDVKFSATNFSYTLDENGEVIKLDDKRKNTGWYSWSVDWDGKDKLITCFKASTQVKTGSEYTNRYGIHKLEIDTINKVISGTFADEFPSSNRGEIYFFDTQEKLFDFIKNFFKENAKPNS